MQSWSTQFIDARSLAVASALVLIGVGVLYAAWRRRERHPMLLATGWGVIAASYYFWAGAAGADAGATIGTVLVMLSAIVLVLASGEWQSKRRATERGAASALDNGSTSDPNRTRRTVLRTIAAGPLGLIGALALAMLTVGFLRSPEADRIVFGACVMLLVWPIAMVWVCAARRLAPPIVTLAAITLVSFCLLPLVR